MRVWRSFALPALILLLALLPGLAGAAPRSIALPDYRAMLREGAAHLERAEQLAKAGRSDEASRELKAAGPFLSGTWRVDTPRGPVDADLTDLERLLRQPEPGRQAGGRRISGALNLAREHLAAAEALEQVRPTDLPGARQSLERALQQTQARSVLQRVNDWFNELLGRRIDRATDFAIPASTYLIGGGVALIALGWLGFSLYRSLSVHAAPGLATLSKGRERRPDRPLTPAELRAQAHDLSGGGEHLEALRMAHLALLQHYDARKLIRYVPAQTNREHEWQLHRRHPHLSRTLRLLNDLVDDRLYSGHGATAPDFLRVAALVDQLWREGDAASNGAEATTGASSSA